MKALKLIALLVSMQLNTYVFAFMSIPRQLKMRASSALAAEHHKQEGSWREKLRVICYTVSSTLVLCASSPEGVFVLQPSPTYARNLPESNGASAVQRGKPQSLAPIIKFKRVLVEASANALLGDLLSCSNTLSSIPANEQSFKRVFDEHSEGVSYKQVFLDQNAFLVYYSKGFDGPNRPSIEQDDESSLKEKMQFGYRNDAWVGLDDAKAEVEYLVKNPQDKDTSELKRALREATAAIDKYISLDAPVDIELAEKL